MIDVAFQNKINQKLLEFFAKKRNEGAKVDRRIGFLIDQIADITLRGGDRQRPYFCFLGFQAAGGKNLESIFPAFLALELFHSFALIHDDIMDQGEMRRGGPTIHAHFTQNLRNHTLAGSLALLAGDLCAQWAQELFDSMASSHLASAQDVFNSLREEVMYGQIRDVWGMQSASVDDIRDMYRQKSGNYSVEKPLLLGAMLVGGTERLLDALSRYGQAVGLAFQLKDDLLGLFGDSGETGKTISGDVTEGKWTMLIALTIAKLNPQTQSRFGSILGNRHATHADILWVKTQIVDSGAKQTVEREMQELVRQALYITKSLPEKYRHRFAEIATHMISRKT